MVSGTLRICTAVRAESRSILGILSLVGRMQNSIHSIQKAFLATREDPDHQETAVRTVVNVGCSPLDHVPQTPVTA